MTARWVVLASGSGTLFQALLDSPERGKSFEIVALITDQPDAGALLRAAKAGLQVAVLPLSDFANRAEWNLALADAVDYFQPNWVVSAGFMRIIGQPLLGRYPNRILNTHPALLPNFKGAHAVKDALAAGATETGATVHFVDEGMDTGAVIVQAPVEILSTDNEESLHERIKIVERRLLLETVLHLSNQATDQS